MQGGGAPVRPVALQGNQEIQQILDLIRAQPSNRSAFSSLPQQPAIAATGSILPEFNLYHAAQLSGLLNNGPTHVNHSTHNQGGAESLSQFAQFQQIQNLQNQANFLGTGGLTDLGQNGRNLAPPRSGSRNEKSSTAYASRHQAAEQRRRNRINDRLDLLRKVVPHSERANTATFLEEVIKYVGDLQNRISALETAQGLPLTCTPKQGMTQALNELTQPSQKVLNIGATQSAPVLSGISQPVTIFPESHVNTSNAAQSTLQKDRPATPSQSTDEVEGKSKEEAKEEEEEVEPDAKRYKSEKVEPV